MQNQSIATTESKKSSSFVKLIFLFETLKIREELKYRVDKLLENIFYQSYNIFKLFFNDDILFKLVNYINKYVAQYMFDVDKLFARK